MNPNERHPMTTEPARFAFSDDEELFHSADYETRELCAEAAPEELSLLPGDSFWVGEATQPNGEEWTPNARYMIEYMREQCFDSDCGGEWSESWLNKVKKEDMDSLTEAVRATVAKWMDDTGNRPAFFTVKNVTKHTAPGAPHER